MFALRLDPEIEDKLTKLAKKTGRSKSHYAKLAIERFLEDCADYLLAVKRLEESDELISLKEMKKRLGLSV